MKMVFIQIGNQFGAKHHIKRPGTNQALCGVNVNLLYGYKTDSKEIPYYIKGQICSRCKKRWKNGELGCKKSKSIH